MTRLDLLKTWAQSYLAYGKSSPLVRTLQSRLTLRMERSWAGRDAAIVRPYFVFPDYVGTRQVKIWLSVRLLHWQHGEVVYLLLHPLRIAPPPAHVTKRERTVHRIVQKWYLSWLRDSINA